MEIRLDKSWLACLQEEFSKPYFRALTDFVRAEYTLKKNNIFPKASQIFRALDACPFEQVKVVIIGQDPYPTPGHANGLCFSLNPDVRPLAKSLINVYKEIESDLNVKMPDHGDLSNWAHQGVLLLNSILTVEKGSPLSHQGKGWEQFTDEIVRNIVTKKQNCVFLLWGSKAIDKVKGLDLSNHLVLSTVHPSPLSAYRGFFGCKHFSKTNAFLRETGQQEIQWNG